MVELIRLFESLQPPAEQDSSGAFAAVQIEQTSHRLAMNKCSQPTILLFVQQSKESHSLPNIELQNLSIKHDLLCKITDAKGVSCQDRLTVITCTTDDLTLQRQFLKLSGPLISVLGASPSISEVNSLIDSIVNLFRAMGHKPARSIRALWSELFLIAESKSPKTAVLAWRSTIDERFDFGLDNERVEVKSSGNRSREHYFSTEQLNAPSPVHVLVASVFVESSSSGPSIADLYSVVRERVFDEPSVTAHLDQVFHASLGDSWPASENERYDLQLARNSLTFYECNEIPQIPMPLPAGVTEVRYKSKLPDSGNFVLSNKVGELIASVVNRSLSNFKRATSKKQLIQNATTGN